MKKLNLSVKLLFCVIPLSAVLSIIFHWYGVFIEIENKFNIEIIMFGLGLTQLAWLIFRILRHEVSKQEKINQILLCLIFTPYQFYYIWWVDDKLVEKQNHAGGH